MSETQPGRNGAREAECAAQHGRGRLVAAEAQRGSAIIIAVAFVTVFISLGLGLYFLLNSQTRSTETERTDIKSFNVAEAGLDAGMLALKLAWPDRPSESVTVDEAFLKAALKAANPTLWDAKRSDPAEFIQVSVYDNSDRSGNTVEVPPEPEDRVYYDANRNSDGSVGDGLMFVESNANVDDDRHRILIQAERQRWDIAFVPGLALWAGAVGSNGQGLAINIESGAPPVYFDVHEVEHKGVAPGPGVQPTASFSSWESVFNPALQTSLLGAARSSGTYFTNSTDAQSFLTSGNAAGRVVYLETSSAVTIASNVQIGTVEEPVVLVIDAPSGSTIGWDMKGGADFYGVVVVVSDCELRGTCGIHGAVYTKGTVTNKGTGSSGEINFNAQVLANIRAQHVMSVNILPNSWEEYTGPRTSATTTP